jgi:glycosyltransferase 2 family protein
VGLLFAAAALTFLGVFVARNVEQLQAHRWSIRPGLLLLSILLNILSLGWGVRVWQLVLRRLDTAVAYLSLARVWFLSSLGRYIPGKVWQFVGAAHLGGSEGLAPVVVVTSLAVHTGFFLLGAMLVAVYLLPTPLGDLGGLTIGVLRWSAPLLLLLAHPAVIDGGLRLLRRVSRGAIATWHGSLARGAALVLFSAVGWLISGVAFFLFVLSLTPLPWSAIGGLIGANALAFVAGYVVFIAPAGLGAKETALTALLTFYVPAPVAALLAVAARLWMVAAEVIPALLLLRRPASPAASVPAAATRRDTLET